jgi:tryptophan synthase alpha chain
MNRINKLFQIKTNHILSVYFTAGYPELNATTGIIRYLEASGADMVEIGMPFSDPMADGPVIQSSSNLALKNGMCLRLLFSQLKDIRKDVGIPLLLMGYLNPILQFGVEEFCIECSKAGIDGIILPDLPAEVFNEDYKRTFDKYGLINIFLITPQTSEERVRKIDYESKGFIYMVSSSSTTGIKGGFSNEQTDYFKRIENLKLNNPVMAGFGISNNKTFETVCRSAQGAIIGSAFVKMLSETVDMENDIRHFVQRIRK